MQEQLLRFWCRGGELRQSLLSAENPLAPNFSVFHSFSFLLNLKMKLAFHSLNLTPRLVKSIRKRIVKLRDIKCIYFLTWSPGDEAFDWQQDNDDTAMTKEYPLTLNMLFYPFYLLLIMLCYCSRMASLSEKWLSCGKKCRDLILKWQKELSVCIQEWKKHKIMNLFCWTVFGLTF